jgi:hypothetical protein
MIPSCAQVGEKVGLTPSSETQQVLAIPATAASPSSLGEAGPPPKKARPAVSWHSGATGITAH